MRLPAWSAALALAASVLAACDVPIGPSPTPTDVLAGTLQPTRVQTALTVSARDLSGRQTDRTWTASVVLANGRLPANVFAQHKADFAATVNTSPLDATKKAELVAGANTAFDQLEADLNAAFDGVPHRMTIVPGDRIGDLASARFQFLTKANAPFSADGLYNLATTEYLIAQVSFARGDGNSQAALLGLTGCQFKGLLTQTTATHGCAANGLLAVQNAGAIGVSLSLTLDLSFQRG